MKLLTEVQDRVRARIAIRKRIRFLLGKVSSPCEEYHPISYIKSWSLSLIDDLFTCRLVKNSVWQVRTRAGKNEGLNVVG
jgi:hypothetical protein